MNKTGISIMTKYLVGLAFILCSTQTFSQKNKRVNRSKAEIYEETDHLLEGRSMEIPDRFRDASAVVLAVISTENYIAKTNNRTRTSYQRLIIKLNDKAARDEFSTFTYKNWSYRDMGNRDERVYAIRIEKPSGEKIDLDIESLEKNANDEIAIPNLEINDIIDFGLKEIETATMYYCFSPIIKVLNEDFPILFGFKRYSVDHSFHVTSLSQNGAPTLTRNDPLCDIYRRVFDLEYTNLEPLSGEIWAPIGRTEQTVKIQVCYYPTTDIFNAPMIIGGAIKIKSSSDDNEKARAFRSAFRFSSDKDNYVKFFKKWYKKNFPSGAELSNEEYMNYAFYHFRYYCLIYKVSANSFNESYQSQYLNPAYFVKLMRQVAKEKNIPVDVVFTTNKDVSSFDDGILMSEFFYIIRYEAEPGVWKYMENPSSYQTTGYITPYFQGQDGLALGENYSINRITIPVSDYSDNFYKKNFMIDPNLESKNASVDATSTSTGIFKNELSKWALFGVEFHEDAMKAMLPERQNDVIMERGKMLSGMVKSMTNLEKDPQEKLQMMKELREEDFDIDKYTSFKIINSGVISESDSLIYHEKYTIKEVVEKVGTSYVINISKIALDQVTFTDKQKVDRKNDIYLNYPKSYEYLYHINIPEGYKVYGLDSFKESVNLKYGSIEMQAKEKDNQVIICFKKVYKKSFIPKEDWPTMMEFLEPAMKINDARIVLKKE